MIAEITAHDQNNSFGAKTTPHDQKKSSGADNDLEEAAMARSRAEASGAGRWKMLCQGARCRQYSRSDTS